MRTAPWIIAGLFLSGAAQAQSDQADLVRPAAAADLNSNLARLAANPRDASALIGAGEAALALDDARAAAGFFARADAIESGNGRIKAGLARVMLKLQNPAEALRLFDQGVRLGYPDTTILADRGLAKDMTGDQAGAQRDYQVALARSSGDDELVRRYAASLGISGQVDASEKVLEPLLYKSDRAAWRYRAFILAMNNRQAEARKVADQTMPAQLAAAITPYMQKMPYLTAAQKAAAVHFGHFPQQIGTTIAAIIPTPPAPGIAVAAKPPVTVAAAQPAQAKPLSRAEQRRQRREAARLARTQQQQPVRTAAAAPTPVPAPAPAPPRQVALAQPVAQPAPVQTQSTPPPPTPAPQTIQSVPGAAAASAAAPVRQAQASPAQVQGPPAPGFDTIDAPPTAPASTTPSAGSQLNAITLAQSSTPAAPATQTVQPLPAAPPPPPPAPTPQPNPEATRTLADIIRAIDVPEAERETSIAAVNLDEVAALQAQRRAERQAAAKAAADKAKKDAAAKAKAEAEAKAKKEAEEKKRLAANPSRNWLQVGVGQSRSALGFTMKGLRKKYASLAAQDAWSASWGRTNRLLVGPFASFARAREVESKLKADGADVFAWKSEAGEVVERLGGE
ncbi:MULTISPECIES: tetratricopeptide repeat protein [unclassified Sphingobium]|uniref:tetratricopeptide repeat protein n=1 Tax=unclassified Sphingobium TaxID=2611147 RepID=UPI0035A632A9